MYTTVTGARVPIRMWADPVTVEQAALDQLRNIADVPWVHGVAVMPACTSARAPPWAR